MPARQRSRRRLPKGWAKVTIRHADGRVETKHPHEFRSKRPSKRKRKNYYLTRGWRERRYRALLRDGFKCVDCGATERQLGEDSRLQVHHLTYEHFGGEPLDDLVTVCQPCHVIRDRERRAMAA